MCVCVCDIPHVDWPLMYLRVYSEAVILIDERPDGMNNNITISINPASGSVE